MSYDLELIRTLAEFIPPEIIERWIEDEKKKIVREDLEEKESNDD